MNEPWRVNAPFIFSKRIEMEHILQIAVGTVTMRPYVFAFLAVYLVAAVMHLGWRTTLWFTVVGYLISFASEVSSINTGFPYGWYYYLDATKDRELWIAGVPFFDSLSYVFLAYCSYATALLVLSPIKTWRWDLVNLGDPRHPQVLVGSLSWVLCSRFFWILLSIRLPCREGAGFLARFTAIGRQESISECHCRIMSAGGLWEFCMILALQIIDRRGDGKRVNLRVLRTCRYALFWGRCCTSPSSYSTW